MGCFVASSKEYIQFACDQVLAFGAVRAQLMFGDYMIYLNERPIILICDDVPFVKKLPELAPYLERLTPIPTRKPRRRRLSP